VELFTRELRSILPGILCDLERTMDNDTHARNASQSAPTDIETLDSMPKVTFIEHDGTSHTVAAEVGWTVMETALRNGVTGIVAECGGACACATCLVHVDDAWSKIVGPASSEEEEMLDTAFDLKPTSRLSCQIKVTEALDGLVVHTPAYQGR
jgi:ferredoxin, 2Fe-2S